MQRLTWILLVLHLFTKVTDDSVVFAVMYIVILLSS